MKKVLTILSILILISGCSKNPVDLASIKYKDIYQLVVNNDKFITKSKYYDFSLSISKLENGQVRYYLFIDNPRIAMYDIEVLVLLEGASFENNEDIAPTVGIFENKKYKLVPFQTNLDEGFVKGLMCSGLASSDHFRLNAVIQWKSEDLSESNREFITIANYKVEEANEEAKSN